MKYDIRVIGNGGIGGKASGFFNAKEFLLKSGHSYLERLDFPETVCIGDSVFDEFLDKNKLRKRCYTYRWQDPEEFEALRREFLSKDISRKLRNELRALLEEFDYPLAIRSSSNLEDRPGTSFAGKYDTVFISNKGTIDERLKQLEDAIRHVYASTYNPSAIEYRRKHNLEEEAEKMSIMIQRAIGREYKGYFFPLIAGVAFSQNGYCWNREIRKEDGIVRLVFGLGTRAVGRGYARIFSPGKPLARPEGTDAAIIKKFSQETVDVLDLKANVLKQIHFTEVVSNGLNCYPRAEKLFSLRDGAHLYIPVSNMWNSSHTPVLTFDYVLSHKWLGLDLPRMLLWIMKVLEAEKKVPVDIEFAVRVDDDSEHAHLFLVQARPLSQREEHNPKPIPFDLPDKDKLFSMDRSIPTGEVRNLEYIVYVDPDEYMKCPHQEKYDVARVIGKINQVLEGKPFMLIGPGRWGSWKPDLGVPARYSEISNCRILAEIAKRKGDYLPEVSYGTHFFQDLIEDGIIYVPLYPDEPGIIFNEEFLKGRNSLPELLKESYYRKFEDIIKVIHVPSVSGGRYAHAVLNGENEKGLVFLK